MKPTANQIANFLLIQAREYGDYLTNLKLQKLLYYSQAWHLALYDEPLFNDELQAWVHGPVVPHVYGQYKAWGFNPITADATFPTLAKRSEKLIKEVYQKYSKFTGYELEQMTHEELPWNEARGGIPLDQTSNSVLSKETMKSSFKAKLQGA